MGAQRRFQLGHLVLAPNEAGRLRPQGLEQVNGFDTTRAVLTVLLGLGALLALGSLHAGSVWF